MPSPVLVNKMLNILEAKENLLITSSFSIISIISFDNLVWVSPRFNCIFLLTKEPLAEALPSTHSVDIIKLFQSKIKNAH